MSNSTYAGRGRALIERLLTVQRVDPQERSRDEERVIEPKFTRALEGDRRGWGGQPGSNSVETRSLIVNVRERNRRASVLDPVLPWAGHLEAISKGPDQRLTGLAEGSIAAFGGVGPIGPPFAANHLGHIVRTHETPVAESWNLPAALGAVDEVDRSPRCRDGWFIQNARENALSEAEGDGCDRRRRAVRATDQDLVRA